MEVDRLQYIRAGIACCVWKLVLVDQKDKFDPQSLLTGSENLAETKFADRKNRSNAFVQWLVSKMQLFDDGEISFVSVTGDKRNNLGDIAFWFCIVERVDDLSSLFRSSIYIDQHIDGRELQKG